MDIVFQRCETEWPDPGGTQLPFHSQVRLWHSLSGNGNKSQGGKW